MREFMNIIEGDFLDEGITDTLRAKAEKVFDHAMSVANKKHITHERAIEAIRRLNQLYSKIGMDRSYFISEADVSLLSKETAIKIGFLALSGFMTFMAFQHGEKTGIAAGIGAASMGAKIIGDTIGPIVKNRARAMASADNA